MFLERYWLESNRFHIANRELSLYFVKRDRHILYDIFVSSCVVFVLGVLG